jgi:hypothetical protein
MSETGVPVIPSTNSSPSGTDNPVDPQTIQGNGEPSSQKRKRNTIACIPVSPTCSWPLRICRRVVEWTSLRLSHLPRLWTDQLTDACSVECAKDDVRQTPSKIVKTVCEKVWPVPGQSSMGGRQGGRGSERTWMRAQRGSHQDEGRLI